MQCRDHPTGGADHRHRRNAPACLAEDRPCAPMLASRWGSLGASRLATGGHSFLLDQRCPFLCHLFQGFRDLVGGHARDPQIEPHAFGIVSGLLSVQTEGHCG